MPTTYNSTDTPVTIPIASTINDIIVVPSVNPNNTCTALSVNVQITAPDEGNGLDYSLLGVTLIETFPNSAQYISVLQTGSTASMANVDFPATPPLQSMNQFLYVPANNTWTLQVINVSQVATGSLNSWALTITYPAFTPNQQLPGAPLPRSIPGGLTYGKGGNVKQNNKLYFNLKGNLATSGLVDNVKVSNITGFIRDLVVSAISVGTTNISMSLHKVSNQVDTVQTSTITLNAGTNYSTIQYASPFPILAGDLVYLTLDSVGSGASMLSATVTLNGN